MVPQSIGAMGITVDAHKARVKMEGSANGGLGPRAALVMLAQQAKELSQATLNADDIKALGTDHGGGGGSGSGSGSGG